MLCDIEQLQEAVRTVNHAYEKKQRAETDSSHTNATCIISMGKYLTVGRSSSTQKEATHKTGTFVARKRAT